MSLGKLMKTLSRESVYQLIDGERDYQDNLPPSRSTHAPVDVGGYLSLMQHYLNEAHKEWAMNPGDTKALDVVRKITALGVHCMEDHGAPARKHESMFPILIEFEQPQGTLGVGRLVVEKPEHLPPGPFRVIHTRYRG